MKKIFYTDCTLNYADLDKQFPHNINHFESEKNIKKLNIKKLLFIACFILFSIAGIAQDAVSKRIFYTAPLGTKFFRYNFEKDTVYSLFKTSPGDLSFFIVSGNPIKGADNKDYIEVGIFDINNEDSLASITKTDGSGMELVYKSPNYINANDKRKELINTDDYTIEHILPQNPNLSSEWRKMLGEDWKEIQQKYLHTLGNLTLTGYNSELSDKPFEKKKTIEGGFNVSPLHLNKFMQSVDVWNEEQIQKRAVELAQKASKIWQSPNLPEEVLIKYKPVIEKETSTHTLENYAYIAFKSSTNFVDIEPRKSRLRLSLNIDYPQIIDLHGLCKDISDLGRWGNGDVEVGLSSLSEMDNVMDLIQQAFDFQ